MQKIQKFCINHPYIILFLSVLYYFSFILFNQIHMNWIGDLYIYIEIAQNMFSGGVLYRDVIDTKNIGFFFFFYYIIYFPYALLFSSMEFFFVWQAIFLSLWYFVVAIMIYHILLPIYNKKLSLGASFLYLIFIAYPPHSYFINQPQIALFGHLLLILVIMNTYHKNSLFYYMIYGVILGFSFSISSPYAFLVLIIPILALIQYQKDKIFMNIIQKGIIAFIGFLLALLPFVIYLYCTNSFSDWFYWNFTFPTSIYSSRAYTFGEPRDLSMIHKIFLGIWSMLGGNIVLGLNYLDSFTAHLIIYMPFIAWVIILYKKQLSKISSQEKVLTLTTVLCILSRIGLIRVYPSYNIYIIPFIILSIPLIWNTLSSYPVLKKTYLYLMILAVFMTTINMPIRYFVTSFKIEFFEQLKQLTINNPTKTPTVMLSQWTGYTYSTRWKHVYYNFYHFLDQSFQDKVYEYLPEVLIIRKFTFDHQLNSDMKFMTFINENYHFIEDSNRSILEEDRTNNGEGKIFIRKDAVSSWKL
ncbi:MAG: hypothetical protein KFW21_02000 [Spirochaetota bacterium]|nr:hypothetical protein [Spirochaetota bacterium]